MKFGTYFAYWEQEWEGDFEMYCQKVSSLGFDILEVGAGALVEMDEAALKSLRAAAEREGVELTACIGLPKAYDVSSADEDTRQKGVAFLKKIIDKMEIAGIHALGGIVYAYWPCDYSEPVDKEQVRATSIKSLREAADYAKLHGVTLMLETVNRFEHFLINCAQEAVEFVKDVDRENVKVMLDCFHMNIEEDDMGGAIRSAKGYLGHFHIGECNRKVPGKGRMPWDEMGRALREIGYDGAVVMEPFVRMGGTVGSDIKVWRDLSGGADDAQLDREIAESLQFVKEKFAGK